MRTTWTKQRTALLKRMWNAGASAGAIVDAIGADVVSRSAVLGKVSRLGLQRSGDGVSRKSRKGVTADTYAPSYAGVALGQHKSGTCIFPIGDTRSPDFKFCGATIEKKGAVYCASCSSVAYVPIKHKEEG